MNHLFLLFIFPLVTWAGEVAITIDDLTTKPTPLLSATERSQKILEALRKEGVKSTMFVCGKRVDNEVGKELLRLWNRDGHQMANHTYSHFYYHSSDVSFEGFREDFLKGETIISGLSNFTRIFRFPYLKNGNTISKRDDFRKILTDRGYRHGYVTIDASDWYVDQRLKQRLASKPDQDLTAYRDYYLNHIWDRTQYYDKLAKKVLNRTVKHTLLIHDNLLNALFLGDLIRMFKSKGWTVIDSAEAFKDPVFSLRPEILPAGESIIWAVAKKAGITGLRYPAEDGKYEEAKMDALGL